MASLPVQKPTSVTVVNQKIEYLSTIEAYNNHVLKMKNGYKSVVNKVLHSLTDGVKDYGELRDFFGEQIYRFLSREQCAIDVFSSKCLTAISQLYLQMVGRDEMSPLTMTLVMCDWEIDFTVELPSPGKIVIKIVLTHTSMRIVFKEKVVQLVFHTQRGVHDRGLFFTKQDFDTDESIFELFREKPIIERECKDIFRLINFMLLCPTCHRLKWVRKYTRPSHFTISKWPGDEEPVIYDTTISSRLCIRDFRTSCDKCINMWKCTINCTICSKHESAGVFACYKKNGCCHRICYQKIKYRTKERNEIQFYSKPRYMF